MPFSLRFHPQRAWRSAAMGGAVLAGLCVSDIAGAQVGMSSAPTLAKPSPSSPYVNYQPYACSFIAERLENHATNPLPEKWFPLWPGTPAAAAAADSAAIAPALAKAVADVRACLEPFTPETTAPNQLLGLGTAWLSINEDAKAEAAFARLAETVAKAPPAHRSSVLRAIVRVYAGHKKPRFQAALRYMAQLDALGTAALGDRVTAHNHIFDAAVLVDSLPIMKEQAEIALRLGHTIEGPQQVIWLRQIARSAAHQGHYMIRIGNPSEAEALMTQAQAELAPLGWVVNEELGLDIKVAKVSQQVMYPIQASFVYFPGDTAPRTSLPLPQKGRVTVYLSIPGLRIDGGPINNYELVRDIATKYGSQVDIVILQETTGWASKGDGMVRISGKDEAKQIRDFQQGFMKMPYPIAVWERNTSGKLPDGRLIYPENPNLQQWRTPVFIVDKKGQIRYVRPDGPYLNGPPNFASGLLRRGIWHKGRNYGGDVRWMKIIGDLVNEP